MANWSSDIFYVEVGQDTDPNDIMTAIRLIPPPAESGAYWALNSIKQYLSIVEIHGEGRWGTCPTFTDETWALMTRGLLAYQSMDGFTDEVHLSVLRGGVEIHHQEVDAYDPDSQWVEYEGESEADKGFFSGLWMLKREHRDKARTSNMLRNIPQDIQDKAMAEFLAEMREGFKGSLAEQEEKS